MYDYDFKINLINRISLLKKVQLLDIYYIICNETQFMINSNACYAYIHKLSDNLYEILDRYILLCEKNNI